MTQYRGQIRDISFSRLLEQTLARIPHGSIAFILPDKSMRHIYFTGGYVTGVSSNDPADYLGQYFICEGILTKEGFDLAFATEQETGIKLGSILALTDQATPNQITEILLRKIIDTCFIIFCMSNGEFLVDDTAPDNAKKIEIRLKPSDILSHITIRQQELPHLIAMFPELGEFPDIPIPDSSLLWLPFYEQIIMAWLASGKGVHEILRVFPGNFYMKMRYFYHLFINGHIIHGRGSALREEEIYSLLFTKSSHTEPSSIPVPGEQEKGRMFLEAQSAEKKADFTRATLFYWIIHMLDPDNIVFAEAVKNAEYHYIHHFYQATLPLSTRVISGEGTGSLTDPLERQLLEIISKSAFSIREIVHFFKEKFSEARILNALERVAGKHYIKQQNQSPDT